MPKGTPFFMPWEVHSRLRLIKSTPQSRRFIYDLLSSRVAYGAEEQWPPFYRYDYDLESLWWILLWACLFCVSSNRRDLAHDLQVQIGLILCKPHIICISNNPFLLNSRDSFPSYMLYMPGYITAMPLLPMMSMAIWKFISHSGMVWTKCRCDE